MKQITIAGSGDRQDKTAMTLKGASAAFEPAHLLRAARQQRSLSGAGCEMGASRRRFGTTF
jgi:hypothetical protein